MLYATSKTIVHKLGTGFYVLGMETISHPAQSLNVGPQSNTLMDILSRDMKIIGISRLITS